MVGTAHEFDEVLELCRDQHRRIVLAVLAHERRPLTLNDLAKTIVKYNHHVPVTEVPNGELDRIRIFLFHVHVPKLADLSLVEYDRERQRVEPTAEFDRLEPQLSAIVAADPVLEAPTTL